MAEDDKYPYLRACVEQWSKTPRTAELVALLAERDALLADKRRMDWLENNQAEIHLSFRPEDSTTDPVRFAHVQAPFRRHRAAIDAAIQGAADE